MKQIIRFRWVVLAAWIVVAACLFIFSPNLQELVREKGQIGVPDGYSSTEAAQMIERMSENNNKDTISAVMVFHEDEALTDAEKSEVGDAIETLQDQSDKLGLSEILSFQDDPRIEEQVVSEDNTTILVPFEVSLEDREIEKARDEINEAVEDVEVDHLLTGEAFISQDVVINSEEGLKKTEYITVGFILLILFIVFRSLVAPFIPLLTVGISYLAAQGVVSILADTIDFPLSTFTQIFMVAVMFGIGTDYCILLISRFKEELAHHESVGEAVIATYKAAGKTVFFSGLAVLIGFSTIGLSTFSLYQSAVAVAVGVAVVLIALATLVPFFLVVLGKKLFWPFDKNVSHSESKLWGSVGSFAWTRPLIALLIVLAFVVPSLVTYDGSKSYNSLEEIGDEYGSVKAFDWISDSVGPGEAMPTTVVLETKGKIDSSQEFEDIELISKELANIDGVKSVRSATRPTGELLEDFTITSQTGQLGEGIGKSIDGIDQIQSGLADGASQLKESQPQLKEAESGVEQLLQGTQQANNGIGDMKNGLSEIQNGIESGASGAGEIKAGLQEIQKNLQATIDGNKDVLAGYQEIENGLSPIVQGYIQYTNVLSGSLNTLNDVDVEPEDQEKFDEAKGQIKSVIDGTSGLTNTLQKDILGGMSEANTGFQKSISGQEQLSAGLTDLINAVDQLQNGLNQAADGQQQVVQNIPALQNGLTQIYGGQEELKQAFSDMQDQLGQLSDGLTQSSEGLVQISDGLTEVQNYLDTFSSNETTSYVSIPDEALENEEFLEGIQPYLSDDKTITKLEVVLEDNPYSTESVELIDTVEKTVEDAIQGTSYEDAKYAIGGISSTNHDLQSISDEDYSRTVVLMLSGIFIILIILLRSLIMPIYLIGSLVLTYFTAMGLAEIIFVNIMGYEGLSWAVPFFAFVILVALGIDYSIFLMDRFNENKAMSIRDGLLHAMKNMGTVIISAAVILGGTFAAMLPSGVLSLLQIATVVLIGLFLYALIMLPLFIPVMVRFFGKLNWWPFSHNKE
ncbi:MMPL family transporter [Radiobacillus kanasensis]|uniref:MMPL family transporter n=1 Tax=Radiobacillus kanasensis TaxID=2844358 RepID=UPI001E44E15B|nr:MMPL family transporter [Radiobacillus kanasensis]UFU00392.1 MMPL family transporter [Radiobacillus kanasensis]